MNVGLCQFHPLRKKLMAEVPGEECRPIVIGFYFNGLLKNRFEVPETQGY
jgi:hypothetical protein